MSDWATREDWEYCRELHRSSGASYYIASRCFTPAIRRRIDAVFAFVRVPNEWLANPEVDSAGVRDRLVAFRKELQGGLEGIRPSHPVLRAFVDVATEADLALNEPFLFLDAMESDLTVVRYPSYADLERFMRGTAASVGMMLLDVWGIKRTPMITEGAMALAEAIQLTNILRDVGADLRRSRLYLPLEDMDQFGVTEEDLYNCRVTAEFIDLMKFEIRRASELYVIADKAIPLLPIYSRRPVRLARVLYSRILDRIESAGFDVFHRRVRTTGIERAAAVARAAMFR